MIKRREMAKTGVYKSVEGKYEAYCMKCKESVKVTDPMVGITSNGRRHLKGTHKKCGTTLSKMLANA